MHSVMEVCSSAIRGAIVAPEGKKLVIADLSNIEGRMLAWLAGEEWKLQAFRDYDTIVGHDEKGKPIRKGYDLYKLAYARAFGIHPDEVDDHMRQIGKVKELMLGYEGGVGAYITGAATYRIDLEAMAEQAVDTIPEHVKQEALRAYEWAEKQRRTFGLSKRAYVVCDAFKRLWRNSNPQIASWWKEVENNVVAAIVRPGVTRTCRRVKIRRDGNWLRIGLPSGRVLCYPSPQVDDQGKVSYMGINQYSRKWQRLKTYGGKLVENITQAAARDIMAAAMPAIEAAGYQIVLSVHDEFITETPDTDDYSSDGLAALMSTNPEWAEGLPLAAAGFETYRYRKD